MLDYEFIWNEGPGGNVEHIALNDLTPEDVIHAFHHVIRTEVSRSSGAPGSCRRSPNWGFNFCRL